MIVVSSAQPILVEESKTMKKMTVPKLAALFTALVLTGCAGVGGGEASVGSGAGGVSASDLAMAAQIPPGGAKILYESSLIIGSGENWMGRLVIEISQGSSAAYNFFLDQYPKQGWTLVSAVRGKSSLLVFTKPDRSVAVELTEGGMLGGALATLTVTPKSALPTPASVAPPANGPAMRRP